MRWVTPTGLAKQGPDRVRRLNSTLAVIEELPDGAWLIVPPIWADQARRLIGDRDIHIMTDVGGIHAIGDIPAGATVGVGQGAYESAHEFTRHQAISMLLGKRFGKVIWA